MNPTEARALAASVLSRIAPEADLADVGDNEDLRAAIDLDSMDFMNFLIALSERTGHAIPEADTPRLHTLRGLIAYLSDVAPSPPGRGPG